MRAIANLLTAIILGSCFLLVATVSIQNITPLSLRFLTWESVEIPFGILLTATVAVGLLIGAILPLLKR
ncbi:DUF1049 domain-containing protein [Spirulina sp. CCNP1310]|uniref:DUF1049 domain-containing protein n=1 Tax=Spirulina sp. CCNP1310 TaxID=3110249 RepID=UPI002B1EF556|nr:DUF1049 domain-containing protein [Spirulina sp. CCNP1310]MEA5418456.1 DUF1049 domain-containing protein [Spirulina sp. CCNP1310]